MNILAHGTIHHLSRGANGTSSRIRFLSQVHYAPAMAVAFSPVHSALLASAGLDKRVLFFDVNQKK